MHKMFSGHCLETVMVICGLLLKQVKFMLFLLKNKYRQNLIHPPFDVEINLRSNIYTITEDKEGFIWLGSKGGGLLVSKSPVKHNKSIYSQINFYNYRYNASDSTSLSNDNIYTIHQDRSDRIFISWFSNSGSK